MWSLKIEGSSPPADKEHLYHLARSYLLSGEYDAATAMYSTLLADADSNPSPWDQASHYNLGLIALVQGQPSASVHLQQSSLLNVDEKLAERARQLRTLIRQLENDVMERHMALGLLGASLLAVGEVRLARRSLEDAVALFPEYAEAISLLGYLSWLEGDYPRAESLLQRSLSLEPDGPMVHYFLGVLRRAEGRLGEARASFERAITLDPEGSPAFVELGQTLVLSREYALAARALERAIEIDPNNVGYHLVLARFYLDHALGLDRALIVARRASELEPNDARVLDVLGWALWTNGHTDDAQYSLAAAIAADPRLASAHYHLAVALERTGDSQAAAMAYRRAYELEPNSPSGARAETALGNLVLP